MKHNIIISRTKLFSFKDYIWHSIPSTLWCAYKDWQQCKPLLQKLLLTSYKLQTVRSCLLLTYYRSSSCQVLSTTTSVNALTENWGAFYDWQVNRLPLTDKIWVLLLHKTSVTFPSKDLFLFNALLKYIILMLWLRKIEKNSL